MDLRGAVAGGTPKLDARAHHHCGLWNKTLVGGVSTRLSYPNYPALERFGRADASRYVILQVSPINKGRKPSARPRSKTAIDSDV